jgi:hypothetical protein
MNIAGINAAAFGMWDCDKERNNSKYQNYQPDYGQSSHAQILRLDCILKLRSEYMSLASDATRVHAGGQKTIIFLQDPARPDLSLCRIPKLARELYQASYGNA